MIYYLNYIIIYLLLIKFYQFHYLNYDDSINIFFPSYIYENGDEYLRKLFDFKKSSLLHL